MAYRGKTLRGTRLGQVTGIAWLKVGSSQGRREGEGGGGGGGGRWEGYLQCVTSDLCLDHVVPLSSQ